MIILLRLGFRSGDGLFQDPLETEENHKYSVKVVGNLVEIQTESDHFSIC
jgi:hypothetical protein